MFNDEFELNTSRQNENLETSVPNVDFESAIKTVWKMEENYDQWDIENLQWAIQPYEFEVVMKEIRVKFVDFWRNFNCEDNFILQALRENYLVVIDEKNPNYLFYSCFGHSHHKYTDYECIKVYYTGENLMASFNECDYAVGFDYLDFGDRFLRFPLYEVDRDIYALISREHMDADMVSDKTGFCNFIFSNRRADPYRDAIFDKISEYKQVDSAGRHRPNVPSVDLAVDEEGRSISKQQFQNRYKFTISAENSSHPGYTTEKIIDAFAARTVPIYWGDPLVIRDINPEAFINATAFPTLNALAAEVARLDQDQNAYLNMLNAPVFTKSYLAAAPKKEQLTDFLSAIVEQPIEVARRRPKYGRARRREARSWNVKYRLARMLGLNFKTPL
jgi:hypothetical protein